MHSVSYFKTYFQIFQTALNCRNNLQLYEYHFPLSGHFYLLFLCIICQYADFYTFLIKQSWIFCFTLYNKCCQKDWYFLWGEIVCSAFYISAWYYRPIVLLWANIVQYSFFYFIDFFPCFFYDMYTLMYILTTLLYKSKGRNYDTQPKWQIPFN